MAWQLIQHDIYFISTCEGYLWHGVYYNTTSTPTYNYLNNDNCPSTDTLKLFIYHGNHTSLSDTAIDQYSWHGTTFTSSGTYTHSYLNDDGCESTDTLHLTILHSSHQVEYAAACGAYTWHGTTYSASGTYTYHYNNSQGIASTDTLHLTIHHGSRLNIDTTVCDTFYWEGKGIGYNRSMSDSLILPNAFNCDSVVTLTLTVHHSTFSDTAIRACDSFYWDALDTLLAESCYAQTHLLNHLGCDSTVGLTLTIHRSDTTRLHDTICQGTYYLFHGSIYTQEALLEFDTLNHYRCDSMVLLRLAVVAPPEIAIQTHIDCARQAYNLQALTQAPYLWWHTNHDNTPAHVGERELTAAVEDTTIYWVTADLRDTLFCPSSDSVVLTPIELPTAHIEVSPTTLDEQHLTLTATRIGSPNRWSQWYVNGTYYSDNLYQITYTASLSMDSVMVQLIAGNDFCQDTDRVAVPIVKPHLFIPNFFMPEDHDPELNTFRVTTTAHIRSYQIAIFDRAGRRVFHADTPNTPWDGTHDGTPCPQAAYVYRISYTTTLIPNSPQCVTGTVVLCR